MARRKPLIDAPKVRELWNSRKKVNGRTAREEIIARAKAKGIDIDSLISLLEAFVQFAPQMLAIIAQVIDLFS